MSVTSFSRRLGVLCLFVFIAACGGGGSGGGGSVTPPPPDSPPTTQLSVSAAAPAPVTEVLSAGFDTFDPADGAVEIDPVESTVFAGAFSADDQLIYLAQITPDATEVEFGAVSTVEALFAYAPPLAPALDEDDGLMQRLLNLPEAQALADYIDSEADWASPTAAFEQAYADALRAAADELAAPTTATTKSLSSVRGKPGATSAVQKVGAVDTLGAATTQDLLPATTRGGIEVLISSNQNEQTYDVEIVNNNNLRWIAVTVGEDPNLAVNTPDTIRLLDVNGGRIQLTLPVDAIPQPVIGDEDPLYGIWLHGFSFVNASLSNGAREAYVLAASGSAVGALAVVVVDKILGIPCGDTLVNAGVVNIRGFAEDPVNAELAEAGNLAGLATEATIALQESIDKVGLAQCFVELADDQLTNLTDRIVQLSERLSRFIPTVRSVSLIFNATRLGLQINDEFVSQPPQDIVRVANLLDSELVNLDSDQSLPFSFYLDADNLAQKDAAVTEPYSGTCDPEAEDTTCEAVLYDREPPFPVNLEARCSAVEPVDCIGAELLLLPGGQTDISASIEFDGVSQVVNHDFEVGAVGEYIGAVFLRDIDGAVSTQTFQLQVVRGKPQIRVREAGGFENDPASGVLTYGNPAEVACCKPDEQVASREFVLSNIGVGTGTISNVSVAGDPGFSVELVGPSSLPPVAQETATARVTYTPPAEPPAEPATATLIIAGELGESSVYDLISGPPYEEYAQIRLPLAVAPPPAITVQRESGAVVESEATVTSILYVPVTQASATEVLTVRNTGEGTLNLDQASVGGTAYQLTGNLPVALATDQSTPFELTYTKAAQREPVDVTFADSAAEVTHVSPWVGLVQYAGTYFYSFVDSSPEDGCDGTGERTGTLQQVGASEYVFAFRGENIVFTRNAQNGLTTTSTITYPEGNGQTTERLNVSIDINGNVSGSATFTYTEGSFSCDGSTTITGQFIG